MADKQKTGSKQRSGSKQKAPDDEKSGDLFWAVIAAAMFGVPTIILGSVTTAWADATGWMLDHQILVPEAADPLVALPAAEGAGLDWARIAIVAGALVVVTMMIRLVSGLVLGSLSRRP
jgi:hypothetical protein